MLTQPQSTTRRSAVLVLGSADPTQAGSAALALPGVAAVTADPDRRQLLVRYDPSEVGADSIRRAVRPEHTDDGLDAMHGQVWLSAWPTLARALPAAASLL